jgi:hypothetical protein
VDINELPNQTIVNPSKCSCQNIEFWVKG